MTADQPPLPPEDSGPSDAGGPSGGGPPGGGPPGGGPPDAGGPPGGGGPPGAGGPQSSPGGGGGPGGGGNPAIRARVPDHVADGVFSTGCIVMTGPNEYIVDFLQTIGRPHRVARRIVIPHTVMPQFIEALQKNLELYRGRFGDPPAPPQNADPNARRPSPQDIYDDLKMPDQVMSGTYANGVMIGHGASEFGLDFLTSFFPQSAVSARVFLAAGQVPRLLDSLRGAVRQYEQRRGGGEPPQIDPQDLV